MADPVVYDKAKWHYEGKFPTGLPRRQAYVHTGMFLAWIVEQDVYSEEFAENFGDEIPLVKRQAMTGARLLEIADAVFADDMLNAEGNAFARDYCDFEVGSYLADYEATFAADLPSLYHVQDTWENYEKIKQVIDRRYREWLSRRGSDRPR